MTSLSDHYHHATRASFKPLPVKTATELLGFAHARNIGKPLGATLPRHKSPKQVTLDHVSNNTNQFFKSRGLSVYYRTKTHVVRISDHWSASNGYPRSRKLNCGYISRSYWAIDNEPDAAFYWHGHGGTKYPYRMLAGICALKDFEFSDDTLPE